MFAGTGLAPIVAQTAFHGARSVVNIGETLVNGMVGFVLAVCGTYLIAIWKGARTLDEKRQSDITLRDGRIAEQAHTIENLNKALVKPPRTQAEEGRLEMVKAALQRGEGARNILLYLRNCGKIIFSDIHVPDLPEGMKREDAQRILDDLKKDNVVTEEITPEGVSHRSTWRLCPALASELDELLHPESNSEISQA